MKTYSGRYAYDEAGQLVREDNRRAGKTYVYVYDIGGNIVSKTEYDYTEDDITAEMTPTDTKTFGYSHGTWNDVLTSYNGVPVAYDAMGNITSFGGDTYEWTAGRQLKKLTEQDGDFFLYYYNESGFLLRYEAYAADGTYNGSMSYYWDGDRLLGCKVVNAPTEDSTGSEIPVRIMYDSDGEAVGFLLADSAPVYYGKNLQGDITALYDHEGTYIVGYIYDAYGNIVNFDIPTDESLSTGEQIGKMVVAFFYASFNPLSYRGYLYAPAIGLSYYLGSRFYCPAICRFLNADVYADTGTGAAGTNMFAYCNNNPIFYTDARGYAFSSNPNNSVATLFYVMSGTLILMIRVGMRYKDVQYVAKLANNAGDFYYISMVILNGKKRGSFYDSPDINNRTFALCESFLKKEVCKLIAPYYKWANGGMRIEAIQQEIFAHAIIYYTTKTISDLLPAVLKKLSIVGKKVMKYFIEHSDPVTLGGAEGQGEDAIWRQTIYLTIWQNYDF